MHLFGRTVFRQRGLTDDERSLFPRGAVKLVVDVIGNAAEFQVEPVTGLVNADQDSTVKITYAPEKNLTLRTQVRLTIEPFQQQILIPITFASEP